MFRFKGIVWHFTFLLRVRWENPYFSYLSIYYIIFFEFKLVCWFSLIFLIIASTTIVNLLKISKHIHVYRPYISNTPTFMHLHMTYTLFSHTILSAFYPIIIITVVCCMLNVIVFTVCHCLNMFVRSCFVYVLYVSFTLYITVLSLQNKKEELDCTDIW